jgi:hypothetical protein
MRNIVQGIFILFIVIIFSGNLLARNDTITVYLNNNLKEKVSYVPGTCCVYKKDGTVDCYKNVNFKIQKMIVPVEENSSQTTIAQVYPQPFDNIVNVEFELQKDIDVFYEIFNQTGQVIFSSNINFMLKGKNIIQWYAIDNQGNSVKSGIYFLKIKNGSSTINEKLLVIK